MFILSFAELGYILMGARDSFSSQLYLLYSGLLMYRTLWDGRKCPIHRISDTPRNRNFTINYSTVRYCTEQRDYVHHKSKYYRHKTGLFSFLFLGGLDLADMMEPEKSCSRTYSTVAKTQMSTFVLLFFVVFPVSFKLDKVGGAGPPFPRH